VPNSPLLHHLKLDETQPSFIFKPHLILSAHVTSKPMEA
jgi:hypothetical protein